jgi:hypothetical protein
MKFDWEKIVILLRLVKEFGYYRVNKEVQKCLSNKERKTGQDFSFEKQELQRLLQEL